MHIGSSFIETTQNKTHHRIYFPKLGFKNSVKQILQNYSIDPNTDLIISLEYLEKILFTRLGGSVAQLVTRGFEDFLLLKEASYKTITHLGNPDLIFPIKERLYADGSIHTPLNLEDLEFIEAKFTMMEVKKVAIHFLHAKTNPTHQNQVADYFKNKGYEVYLPSTTPLVDEGARWHRNLLNASLKGSFDEIKKELTEALQDRMQPHQFYFSSAKGLTFQDVAAQISSSLLGSYFNLKTNAKNFSTNDVLYLGMEKFFFIPKNVNLNLNWQSPWGLLELEHPQIKVLPFNIASNLKIDVFQEITIEKKLGVFDPGPIAFGRGLNLTLLDLWIGELIDLKIDGLTDNIKPQMMSKITNTLMVLAKMAEKSSYSPTELSQLLKKQVIEEIWIQIAPWLESENFVIAGPLAPLVTHQFQSFSKKIKFINQDYWESSQLNSGSV